MIKKTKFLVKEAAGPGSLKPGIAVFILLTFQFFPVKSIDRICFQHLVRSRLDTFLHQAQWSNLSAGEDGKSEKVHILDKIAILLVYKHCRRSKFHLTLTCNCYRSNLNGWSQSIVFLQTYYLPYARHYKPRLVYFFTPFLKTIYVLWPLALCMVSIQERFLIKSGL